jgi:hypothetical protein
MLHKDLHDENRLAWNEATVAHNSHKKDQAAFSAEAGRLYSRRKYSCWEKSAAYPWCICNVTRGRTRSVWLDWVPGSRASILAIGLQMDPGRNGHG